MRIVCRCFPLLYEKMIQFSGLKFIAYMIDYQNQTQIACIMSHYKTPIRIQLSSNRKINQKVGKYRLPFRKDQPVEDRYYTLNRDQRESLVIQSQVLKEKQLHYSSVREGILKQSNVVVEDSRVKGEKRRKPSQKGQNKMQNNSDDAAQQPPPKQNQIRIELVQRNEVPKQEGTVLYRPRMLFETPPGKKARKRSILTQSEQELNVADKSILTDFDVIDPKKQKIEKKTEDLLPVLTIKREPKKTIHTSLKKDSSKDWNTLSKQIEEYRIQNFKKDFRTKKRLKSENELSRRSFKEPSQKNQCLYIQNELKKFNREKIQVNEHYKEDLYKDLFPIPEDNRGNTENSNIKQKQNGFIQKLKQAIEKQEKQSAQPKLKYPLEYYIENYYKIKQINPFFRKLNQLAGCIMLSLGKLKIYQSTHIYQQGQQLNYIYIIILGKVMMINSHKSFKKFALTGESLGEELLFQEGKPYHDRAGRITRPMFHRQQAKALGKVCILRIKPQKYYKMCCQLSSIGNKSLFNLIDNLFRINYFKKQAIFNAKRQRTQSLLNAKYKNSSFFH